ncbi:MAG: hypothetical protein BMS9Abin28_2164 [Anaerolineae bacterium]|nr:MAG: hypothetical protein BMS9Abin28_2164 [Anaerolineae bacterium]
MHSERIGSHPNRVPSPSNRGRDASAALVIFAILTSIYALTYSGSFRVDDEHVLAARAQSLALWGQLTYPQVYGNSRVQELSITPTGSSVPHTVLEPAQAAIGSLMYRAASILGLGGAQAAFTLNLYVTALTGLIVFYTVLQLGLRRNTAILSALTFGLASMAWPYAKTFYRDPLAALMVAIAFLGWVMLASQHSSKRRLAVLLIIVGVVGGMLTKHTATVFVLALGLSSALLFLKGSVSFPLGRRAAVVCLLTLGAALLLILALPDQGSFARYSMTYINWIANRFAGNIRPALIAAFLGPFISPAKSIFIFAPVLILAPVAVVRFRKARSQLLLPAILAVILLPLAQALFHAEQWAGTLTWGLRFMLPAIPLMIVMSAALIDELLYSHSIGGRLVLGVLLASSILIQLSGSIVAWYRPYPVWLERGLDPYLLGAEWDVRFSAVAVHLAELLNPASWDLAWLRTLPIVKASFIIPAAIVAFISACAIILFRFSRDTASSRIGLRAALIVSAMAAVAPIFPGLVQFREDPSAGGNRPEFAAAYRLLSEQVRVGDLVTIDAYGTPLWHFMMNHWTREVPWYSLPFEIPGSSAIGDAGSGMPSPTVLGLFGKMETEFTRLWYVSSTDAPDSGLRREVSWLDNELELQARSVFKGQSAVEVSLYAQIGSVGTNAASVKGLDHRLDQVDGAWRSAGISILPSDLPGPRSP